MTFKQCVTFCLQAPIAAWENMSGRYYWFNFWSCFWSLFLAFLNVGVGVLFCLSVPILAPGLFLYMRATRSKREALEAARAKARFEDL